MKIAVALKAVHDGEDIQVAGDRTLDYSKSKLTISEYDKNAIELAAQLAADGGDAVALTVGAAEVDNSKLKKDILSRGVSELYMAADDACADLDARATAAELAAQLEAAGGADLVVCGDGSADNYMQQVEVQLAEALGWPVVTAVSSVEAGDGKVVCTRTLEDCFETVEVSLPAVVSVTPDAAEPRIPGMKDILAAGKKPMNVSAAAAAPEASLETVECLAPEQVARKQEVMDAADEGAVEKFAAAVKAAL